MRKILPLIVLALSSLSTLYAQYINIGSTKSEVKKIQGEPTTIESYETVEEEIWRYGETGIVTITFKNGKIKGFSNYNGILRIGDTSKKPSKSEKPSSKEELWKELQEKANKITPEDTKETARSITGLYGSAKQDIKTFPKEYEETAEANGLNPYAMPDDIDLQQMQKEYERKKYLKWGSTNLVVIGFLFLIFKLKKKKK